MEKEREREWVDVWRMRTGRNGQREGGWEDAGREGGRGGTMLELNHPSNCMEEF